MLDPKAVCVPAAATVFAVAIPAPTEPWSEHGDGYDLSPWEPFRWPWHGGVDGMDAPVKAAGGALTPVFEAGRFAFDHDGVKALSEGLLNQVCVLGIRMRYHGACSL